MKLAVVGKIIDVRPIEGADLIRQATVVCGDAGKWQGVVGLDIEVGNMVVAFLQDAVLPPDERWAFMERHKWRVRMCRFKKVPSECVILKDVFACDQPCGYDLTEALGVTKHQKPVPLGMQGEMAGPFPSFIPKSDEPNFQTVEFEELMKSGHWYATEKADGTSCTAWVDEDGLHVASRNWELREFSASGATNLYWRVARQYKLEDALPPGYAVQFEIIGPGVQGNPHGLKELEGRLFSVYVADGVGMWKRVNPDPSYPIPTARLLAASGHAALSADSLRSAAQVRYANGAHGEGIVIRATDQSWSFKVINLLYKD